MIRNNKEGQKQSVRLDMTGEQFKRLIEGKDPNNIVDTLNEVLAMFEGISDGETIAEYVKRVAVTPESMPLDSVGTEQIKDDSVMMKDLNSEVKDTMLTGSDRVTEDELNNFEV